MAATAERQLATFIEKFAPDVAKLIRAARKKMRERLPRAIELVYDNYQFFVIGYSPTERPGDAIFSIAAQASGVSLCFLHGVGLPDPKNLLRGTGSQVRNIRLESAATIDRPEVQTLMSLALARAKTPMDPKGRHQLIIRSVSAKQQPRQNATATRASQERAKSRAAARATAAVSKAKKAVRPS